MLIRTAHYLVIASMSSRLGRMFRALLSLYDALLSTSITTFVPMLIIVSLLRKSAG